MSGDKDGGEKPSHYVSFPGSYEQFIVRNSCKYYGKTVPRVFTLSVEYSPYLKLFSPHF